MLQHYEITKLLHKFVSKDFGWLQQGPHFYKRYLHSISKWWHIAPKTASQIQTPVMEYIVKIV